MITRFTTFVRDTLRMFSLGSLLSSNDNDDQRSLEECADRPSGTVVPITCFQQPRLEGVVPGFFLVGVASAERVVFPASVAAVAFRDSAGLNLRTMTWSPTRPVLEVGMREQLARALPLLSSRFQDDRYRCLVIADRFALRSAVGPRHRGTWLSNPKATPLYLGGVWWEGAEGPEFSLLLQPAVRRLRSAAKWMPVGFDPGRQWDWLFGDARLVPGSSWLTRAEFSMQSFG